MITLTKRYAAFGHLRGGCSETLVRNRVFVPGYTPLPGKAERFAQVSRNFPSIEACRTNTYVGYRRERLAGLTDHRIGDV